MSIAHNDVPMVPPLSFAGRLVEVLPGGMIRKTEADMFWVYPGMFPDSIKGERGIPVAGLGLARTILGHTIVHPDIRTTPKSQIKGPKKGNAK